MTMLEKFKEHKKVMHAKFDKAHEICEKSMDEAGHEFIENFKSLVANASEEEFYDFLFKSGDALDDVDRMAAIAARTQHRLGITEDEGPDVVIIGI